MKGAFIVLEGGEGCGKGTQIRRLEEYLRNKGRDVVVVREPGGTNAGEEIRNILLHSRSELSADAQMLLYYAARMQLNNEVIKGYLKEGKIVLSDRYDLSTYIYQVLTQGASKRIFAVLRESVIRPDLEIVIDIKNVQESLERARMSSGTYDRFESKDIEFHSKIVKFYRENGSRIIKPGEIEEVWERLKKVVDSFLDNEKNKFGMR